MDNSPKTEKNNKEQININNNTKDISFIRKDSKKRNSNNNNSLFEENKDFLEDHNNFSIITKSNVNKSTLTDIHKIREYKSKISKLEKQIQKEKEKSKLKTEKNEKIIEMHNKIMDCQKKIKLYINKNNKQREQLQLLSHEIDQKIELIDFKAIKKKLNKNINDNYENKTENEIIELNIESRKKQLENIISLIDILQSENAKLRKKIKKGKNVNNYLELLELKKKQENKINELNKEIKLKKIKLKEHSKCTFTKNELIKKTNALKEEINRNYEKNSEIKKKLDILEKKKQEKENNKYKPLIILNKNNKNINYRNNCLNLKLNLKTESLNKIDINKILNKKDKIKELNKDKDKDKNISKDENKNNTLNNINDNDNNDDNEDDNLKNKDEKNKENNIKKNSLNKTLEEEIINIPPSISEIFTEKELKAILIGLDKDKIKYQNFLKKINVQSTYANILENKHKLDLKNKLNKINELDEKIEFLIIKKNDVEADIQLYKKQIDEEKEIKKLYYMKINKINNEINKKKTIIERKIKEIKVLKDQFIKLKKLIKKGEIEMVKNEPEIEVHYLEDDDDNNIINKKIPEKNNNNQERNVETPTEGTRYEEDNENDLKNIIIKSQDINKIYNKEEEHISSDNNSAFSSNN